MKPSSLLLASFCTACLVLASSAAMGLPRTGAGFKCKLAMVKDEQSQLPAFTFLLPPGWQSESSMRWAGPGLFSAVLSAHSQDKRYGVTQIEHSVVGYNLMRGIPPKGSVMHHATDFLRLVADQLKRQLGVENAETVEEVNQDLPPEDDLISTRAPRVDAMGRSTPVNEAGFLQLKFIYDGVPTIASIGTTFQGNVSMKFLPSQPNQPITEGGTFSVGPTTIVYGPQSPNPRLLKETQVVASSMNMTPQFLSFWQKLTSKLAEAVIKSNFIGQNYSDAHWHEHAMAQFRGQMASKDANTHQFCNYLLEQQDYKDPSGPVVTVPNMFTHAYADGQGDYFLTDDPTTDLRGVGNGNWKEMAKAKSNE